MKKNLERVTCKCWYIKNGKKIDGCHDKISGDVGWIRGDMSGIRGDVGGIRGNVDLCEIALADREKGVDIKELVNGL